MESVFFLKWAQWTLGHLRAGCSSHTGPSVHPALGHPLPPAPDVQEPGSAAQAAGQWALWRPCQGLSLGCGLRPRPPQKVSCGWSGLQPEIGPAGHELLRAPPWIRPGNVGICGTEGRRASSGKQAYFGAFGRQGRNSAHPLVQRREHRLPSPPARKSCLCPCWTCILPAVQLVISFSEPYFTHPCNGTNRKSFIGCKDSDDARTAPGIVCAHNTSVIKVLLPPSPSYPWLGAIVLGWVVQGLEGGLWHTFASSLGGIKALEPRQRPARPLRLGSPPFPLPSPAPLLSCRLPRSALDCSLLHLPIMHCTGALQESFSELAVGGISDIFSCMTFTSASLCPKLGNGG